MFLSSPGRPACDPDSPGSSGPGARALTYRYFHSGRSILNRERIVCVVDASARFVVIWLLAQEERLRLKQPASQHAFLQWSTQSDPPQTLGRWLIQALTTHREAHFTPADASASS